MPEMPEMQALAERLGTYVSGAALRGAEPISISGLKTVVPSPKDLEGDRVTDLGRRGKHVVMAFDSGRRLLLHLGQAGRLDVERPVKSTRPRGAVARFAFDNDSALLVREYGTERKAGWWILAPGDEGPLATLGPEADSDEFAEVLRRTDSAQRLHTWLRDQHVVAGLGRGHTDDICNRARLSPFAAPGSLNDAQRETLIEAIREILHDALEGERERSGGLSESSLGGHFLVHNKKGGPCPNCGATIAAVSFATYEIDYCPACQTDGRTLADRRLSRLLK